MSRGLLRTALAALLLSPTAAWSQVSPSPYTSATRYDGAGRVTGTISADPDGVGSGNPFLAVRNTYDQAGRLTKVETGTLSSWQSDTVLPSAWGTAFSAARSVETQYDAMNRKTRETVREGTSGPIRGVTQYKYDAVGRLECTAVRMNPADFTSPPASACTQGTGGADRITRILYDDADRRVQLREGVGTADEGTETTWAYDSSDRIVAVVDGNGNRAELIYDGHGRQNCWLFPSTVRAGSFNDATPATAIATAGAPSGTLNALGHCATGANANYETYFYDPNGNRTLLTKRDGSTIAFTYDGLNRVTVKAPAQAASRIGTPQELTVAQRRPVHYGYDLRNLQLYARFDSASGEGVTNVHDGFGRLASSSTTMGGTTRTLSYAYDRNGNRTRITHPDAGSVYFDYGYDGLNRPAWIADQVTTRFVIGYNVNGGVAGVIRNNRTFTNVGYDGVQRMNAYAMGHDFPNYIEHNLTTLDRNPAGQLSSQTISNNAYAWTGSRALQRTYTTNGRNQYTVANSSTSSGPGTATYTHDANGNLTSDGDNAYTYDVENRLVERAVGGGTATLVYDPLGRLFSATGSAPGALTRQFLYDGDALVAEYVGGGITDRYVHTIGADVPVMSYDYTVSPATLSYLHANHQGSIIAVSEGSPASYASPGYAINRYDEYGIPTLNSAGENINTGRFQYTGQIWLSDIGMYHYKARAYSPTLGRFLQTDPIGYEDQFNLYAYVANDPVNGVDPTGEKCWFCFGETTTNSDGTVTVRSSEFLRLVVPGQVAWDNARTNMANGNYGAAALDVIAGLGEQALTIATAGASQTATRSVSASSQAMAASRAEGARALAQGGTPGSATAAIVPRRGPTVTGRSLNAGGPGRPTHPTVARHIREGPTNSYAGCCAEVNAISNALNLGVKLRGATIATTRTGTGQSMTPCIVCTSLIDIFGMKPVK